MSAEWQTILSIGIPSLLVAINIWVTVRMKKQAHEATRQIEEYRVKSEYAEKVRQDVLNKLTGLLQNPKTPDYADIMIDIMNKSFLYLPDDVFFCLLRLKRRDVKELTKENEIAAVVFIGEVLLASRKAMGFSDTKVTIKDTLNLIINDHSFTDDEVNEALKVIHSND